jgi:DNA-binding transcriptional regulator YhcF (GntR family)
MTAGAHERGLRPSRVEQRLSDGVMRSLASALDRTLPVPIGVQLRGLIEYGIACGELAPGAQLPSVRELAEAGGVAPMTVSGVYRELREAGVIVTRPGSGTFVAHPTGGAGPGREAIRGLERQIDSLLIHAASMDLEASDVVAIIHARIARLRLRGARPLRIAMVGVFREATEAYAAEIARGLKGSAVVRATTLDELRSARDPADDVDLYITLANRRQEVETIIRSVRPVVGLSFIPSETTRARLAAVDPTARLAIVSVFPEFLALMKPGVLRFTPHVRAVEVALADDPGLAATLERVDVVVHATGAERVLAALPSEVESIEYRHVPDPHAIERELLPVVERLRAGLPMREAFA